MIRRFAALAAVCASSLFAAFVLREEAPPLPHPHFPKTLTCRISKDQTIAIGYQTVTFDKDGAAKMKAGAAWHLAGATFETSVDLTIGGEQVEAGKYALSARKAEKGWQLTLHEGPGFSRPEGDDVHVLATTFVGDSLLFEHLNIDVQPGGDKEHTELFLDVRFDTMLARVKIVLPQAEQK